MATDSYRLSEYKIQTDGGPADLSCIIPSKILDELHAILSGRKPEKDEGSGSIDVALSKQQIEITVGNVRLLSRLIDGKYPDYKQILPKETTTTVLFPTRELTTTVKRMHYFAREVNNNITFSCSPTETKLATPQTQAGKDEATVSAEVEGEEGKIALSSSYLLDFLGHISTDAVGMQMTDSMRPAVFKLADEPTYLHLIMPLRLQAE